jgi:hypothetical protein
VYKEAEMNFGRAHFFTAEKRFLNVRFETFWFNFLVLIIMSLAFYIILITEVLSKLAGLIETYRYNNSVNKIALELKNIIKPVINKNGSNDTKLGAF